MGWGSDRASPGVEYRSGVRVRGTNKERQQMLDKAKFSHAVNGKWAGKGMAAATLGIKVRQS